MKTIKSIKADLVAISPNAMIYENVNCSNGETFELMICNNNEEIIKLYKTINEYQKQNHFLSLLRNKNNEVEIINTSNFPYYKF